MPRFLSRGFVALISTIIISILLLTITAALNFAGFYGRSNIVDVEFKEISRQAARGCVDLAVLKLTRDNGYLGNQMISVGSEKCLIGNVTGSWPSKEFTTQASSSPGTIQKAVTNLRAVVNKTDSTITIVKIEEF